MKKAVTRIAAGAGVAAAGWIAYSHFVVNHRRELAPPVGAEPEFFPSERAGVLAYYRDTSAAGVPLVLIHSVHAAASAYEMRPLFERYREARPVYALDLPGFGFSRRTERDYSPRLYTEAVLDFLQGVLPPGQPADVVALSLGCEFAARAALARPDLFRSLAMMSPTGFSSREFSGGSEFAFRALNFPLWSQAFFDLLTTPPVIRYYLAKSFAGPVDTRLARYDYDVSHRPGARHAPLHFISGRLFTPRVRDSVYGYLTIPVEVLYERDGYVNFRRLPGFLNGHPGWHAVCIAGTRGLPHFEKLRETSRALDVFWRSVMAPAQLA